LAFHHAIPARHYSIFPKGPFSYPASKATQPLNSLCVRGRNPGDKTMTGKITAILAAAVVLASAGVASAQPGRHARWQAPYADSYYNGDYWAGIQGVAPYQTPRFDPYAGTVFQGVAPY
jgi:hypothetical protein